VKPKAAAAKAKPAAAKPKRAPATAARSTRPTPAPEATPKTERQPEPPQKSDPLTDAVRIAGKVAEAGIKTAGQLLRRLPGR
jgi:hypothetical protein